MEYKIVLFDLDGTLTDPKEGITKSVQYALANFGIIEENRNKLLPFIGPPLNKSFQNFYGLSPEQAMQAVSYYREYFSEKGMYENILYNGIPEMLRELNNQNKTLYVVTSKPTFFLEKIIDHFHLEKYFSKVIGPDMDLSNADKAILVRTVLELHPDTNRELFVMAGDREHDIIGAQSNTVASIGVTYGAGSVEEIKKANPTHIADSVDELKAILLL